MSAVLVLSEQEWQLQAHWNVTAAVLALTTCHALLLQHRAPNVRISGADAVVPTDLHPVSVDISK